MQQLFKNSPFNQDISQWDVSNAYDMLSVFENSEFAGNISQWNTSNVYAMSNMFRNSKMKVLPEWHV